MGTTTAKVRGIQQEKVIKPNSTLLGLPQRKNIPAAPTTAIPPCSNSSSIHPLAAEAKLSSHSAISGLIRGRFDKKALRKNQISSWTRQNWAHIPAHGVPFPTSSCSSLLKLGVRWRSALLAHRTCVLSSRTHLGGTAGPPGWRGGEGRAPCAVSMEYLLYPRPLFPQVLEGCSYVPRGRHR